MPRQHTFHTQHRVYARGDHSTGTSIAPRRAVILAVDDEPDALEILEWFLTSEGFEVITATSALAALHRAEERRPDLIITDYIMPQMSGLALCSRLRAQPATQRIPIILHTATDPSIPATERLYDRVITKPGELFDLLRDVRVLLAQPH